MVPRRGLEPPRIAPLVPETSASTSSATWARWVALREAQKCTHWVGGCQSKTPAGAERVIGNMLDSKKGCHRVKQGPVSTHLVRPLMNKMGGMSKMGA